MEAILGFRPSHNALRIPSVQYNGYKDDGGYISVRSPKLDLVRARRAVRASSFPTVTLQSTPYRAYGRSLDRHYACPNPKLPVEVADGVALHCCRVTNLPSLSKEGVVMEGDHGGYFNRQVTRLTGSPLK